MPAITVYLGVLFALINILVQESVCHQWKSSFPISSNFEGNYEMERFRQQQQNNEDQIHKRSVDLSITHNLDTLRRMATLQYSLQMKEKWQKQVEANRKFLEKIGR